MQARVYPYLTVSHRIIPYPFRYSSFAQQYVAEGPWVVRNMVTGRPAIIGRKLPVRYRTLPGKGADAPLCECTLDIGSSSATAKRIVSVCRRYMSGLTSDIGFVIQAESPGELPEQMLGAMRVHGPDPLKAPKIA
jgi:hypothetical protein